jgi:hypothetical protein
MSPDHDSRFTQEDPEDDFEEEEGSRSIFSATWFRAVLVLLGIAVIGVVAVPYVLDVVNPPVEPPKIATAPPTPIPAPAPEAPRPTVAATPSSPASTPSSSPVTPAPSSPPSESAKAAASSPAPKATPPAAAAAVPKSAPPARKEPARETPRSDAPDRTAAKSAPAEKAAPKKSAPAARATDNGDFFVQVGAFKDQAMAMSVAARLRQQNYSVVESVFRAGGGRAAAAAPRPTPPPPAPRVAAAVQAGPDRYDVIVSGASAAEMNAKLTAKGLASEPAGEGVRIRPSLPLRDAVALSKDLGSEGFRVQVRRAGGDAPAPAPAPPAPARPAPSAPDGEGQTLYRVRVGGFPDRAAAQAALRELQDKGFQPFIAKGRE